MIVAKSGKWTNPEVMALQKHYMALGPKRCAKLLGRVPSSVQQKAGKLGLVKEQRYTRAELENIVENYAKKGPLALSEEMNRSQKAIRSMAVRLGLAINSETKSRIAAWNRAKWTQESKDRQSAKMKTKKGEKSPSWKGGVCNVSEMIRGRLYTAWVKYIFQRDGYTCRLCSEKGGKLVAHHTRTFAQIRDAVIESHPELNLNDYRGRDRLADLVIDAHELSDGITLCRSCHKNHHLENGVNCGDILPSGVEDNPQPSQSNVISIVGWKVQRLTGEDTQTNNPDTSAPMLKPLSI